jgi:hypothetical protein
MKMSIESGALVGLFAKFGTAKVLTLGAALIGAAIMIAFRPPKSRKEMFVQAAVALGASLLFGSTATGLAASWTGLSIETVMPAVHGLIGALSWGAFGGLAGWRDDKLAKDPIQAIKDIKDVI